MPGCLAAQMKAMFNFNGVAINSKTMTCCKKQYPKTKMTLSTSGSQNITKRKVFLHSRTYTLVAHNFFFEKKIGKKEVVIELKKAQIIHNLVSIFVTAKTCT
jgi:hypothetical protein